MIALHLCLHRHSPNSTLMATEKAFLPPSLTRSLGTSPSVWAQRSVHAPHIRLYMRGARAILGTAHPQRRLRTRRRRLLPPNRRCADDEIGNVIYLSREEQRLKRRESEVMIFARRQQGFKMLMRKLCSSVGGLGIMNALIGKVGGGCQHG